VGEASGPNSKSEKRARRRILTGEDVRSLPEGSLLEVAPETLITDIAREWIEKHRLQLVESRPASERVEPVRLAIGGDHAGFDVKEMLKGYLTEIGASFFDYGTHSRDSVDYPDFAHRVSLAVVTGHARQGIVVDGAGMGSAITANKVPGIRAAVCHDETQARNAREHNDVNVLAIGSRLIPLENLRRVVTVFLTATQSEPRHRARVAKIEAIESKYYRPL
jgi:ribose 5-phosphate isomerase B